MSALADLRVVDLSIGIAGPFCAKLFADFGADVIKIEPPNGDPIRTVGPFPGGTPDPDRSGMFRYLNTNKRGITLDLESEADRARAFGLCAQADIVVECFAPGYMDGIGLGYETLCESNPAVVLVSVTPFGQTGTLARLPGNRPDHLWGLRVILRQRVAR